MSIKPLPPLIYPSGIELPCVGLSTAEVFDEKGQCIKRESLGQYPGSKKYWRMLFADEERIKRKDFLECSEAVTDIDVFDPDPFGEIALEWGGRFYDEGMECVDVGDASRRLACFASAEILYLHSRERGNPYASLCLGYVYSYDRCFGRYFEHWYRTFSEFRMQFALPFDDAGEKDPIPINFWFSIRTNEVWRRVSLRDRATGRELSPDEVDVWRKEQAAICYKEAADAGIPEAMYKYGDCLQQGVGVRKDVEEAFRWYRKALRYIDSERAAVAGSIAFRLAKCYEEGVGCQASIPDSCEAYGLAVEQLEDAVDNGDWYYQKVLARAREGLARTTQLLSFMQEEELGRAIPFNHIARAR